MLLNQRGRGRIATLAGLLVLAGSLSGLFAPREVQAKSQVFLTATNTIAVDQLPSQAQQMMKRIYQGGPFRNDKDGPVFSNRERLLPAKTRAYYREYTVTTPGVQSRGARRIVCGGLKPSAPDDCYYTDNHYASFRKIVQ